jgi:hypothetical protein
MNDSSNNKITSQIENIDNRSQNGTASHSAQQNIASVTPLLSTPVPSASFSQSNTSDDTAVAQPNVALSHSLQQPPFATSDAETKPVNLSGEELKKVLIQQIEFIMSRDYLASDFNTVSKMNSEYYVPISVVMENSFIKGLTQDRDILLSALKSTDRVIVDEARMMVKPNIKIQRNTIILRDIAPDVPREDIKALFDEYQDKIEDLHSDVGNTWFVSFVNEDITQSAFAVCRSKQFHGKPVQARVKSENLLKSVYYPPSAQPQQTLQSQSPTQAPASTLAQGQQFLPEAMQPGYYANQGINAQFPYQLPLLQQPGQSRYLNFPSPTSLIGLSPAAAPAGWWINNSPVGGTRGSVPSAGPPYQNYRTYPNQKSAPKRGGNHYQRRNQRGKNDHNSAQRKSPSNDNSNTATAGSNQTVSSPTIPSAANTSATNSTVVHTSLSNNAGGNENRRPRGPRRAKKSDKGNVVSLTPAHFPPLPSMKKPTSGYTSEFQKWNKEQIVSVIGGIKEVERPKFLVNANECPVIRESPLTELEVTKPITLDLKSELSEPKSREAKRRRSKKSDISNASDLAIVKEEDNAKVEVEGNDTAKITGKSDTENVNGEKENNPKDAETTKPPSPAANTNRSPKHNKGKMQAKGGAESGDVVPAVTSVFDTDVVNNPTISCPSNQNSNGKHISEQSTNSATTVSSTLSQVQPQSHLQQQALASPQPQVSTSASTNPKPLSYAAIARTATSSNPNQKPPSTVASSSSLPSSSSPSSSALASSSSAPATSTTNIASPSASSQLQPNSKFSTKKSRNNKQNTLGVDNPYSQSPTNNNNTQNQNTNEKMRVSNNNNRTNMNATTSAPEGEIRNSSSNT